ncbi:MAG: T9SS type A sorting domain-containing protein [Bacteroidota bacterium]
MKTITTIFAVFIMGFSITFAQPSIEWESNLGGEGNEFVQSITQTEDEGYAFAGYTKNSGKYIYWVVKLNKDGEMEWEETYGGSDDDFAHSIVQTNDGGYAVAGYSDSRDGDITDHDGGLSYSDNYWIVKLDADGNIEWDKIYGGAGDELAYSIIQTNDNGYAVAGWSSTPDDRNNGSKDYWILKLDENGDLEWDKYLGGSGWEEASSIIQTEDGGYAITGLTSSSDGDIDGDNNGSQDFWLVKLDENGNLEWEENYGGSEEDYANSIIQSNDEGYVLSGVSESSDGDIDDNNGNEDYWIIKVDANGNLEWEENFGGSRGDFANSITKFGTEGYVVAGSSRSDDGDLSEENESNSFWLIQLDNDGNMKWKSTYGGSDNEYAESVIETNNGAIAIAGSSTSSDGDVSTNNGLRDAWVVKLRGSTTTGITPAESHNNFWKIYPQPSEENLNLQYKSRTADNVQITLMTISGRKVLDKDVQTMHEGQKIQLNTKQLPAGAYLLQTKEEGKMPIVQKVILK